MPAEHTFIARHGMGDEARVLRWAYLHALIALPDTLTVRRSLYPQDPLAEAEVGRALMSLRRWISDCARSRLTG